jgi:hypothetical protein
MTLPSIIISVMQVKEGLIKLFFTHEIVMTKLCLDNFNVIGVLTNCLVIIGQNLVFGNAKFITKLSMTLCQVIDPPMHFISHECNAAFYLF